MKVINIAAVVTAGLVSLASFGIAADISSSAAEEDIKIMCVGDSITDGYGVTGSYRKFLYHGLEEKGYSIDMVGSKGGNYHATYSEGGTTFEYDDDNTGYSGYAISSYNGRMGILETLKDTGCLTSTAPDIVTLQIGTNDVIDCYELTDAGTRLGELITYIEENISSEAALFVTTIPDLDPNRSDVYSWFGNYRHSADWQTQYSDEEAEAAVKAAVKSYNAEVRSVVNSLRSKYQNLYLADVNSAVTDVKTQLGDGVHPNNSGYEKMGAYWTDLLDSYLSGADLPTDETEPVSEYQTTTAVTDVTSVTTVTTTTAAVEEMQLACEKTEIEVGETVSVFVPVNTDKRVYFLTVTGDTIKTEDGNSLNEFTVTGVHSGTGTVTVVDTSTGTVRRGSLVFTVKEPAVTTTVTSTSSETTTTTTITTAVTERTEQLTSTTVTETTEFTSTEEETETTGETLPDTSDFECGDVNMDGDISIADIILMNKRLSNSAFFSPIQAVLADTYRDGEFSSRDVIILMNYIVNNIDRLPVLPGETE